MWRVLFVRENSKNANDPTVVENPVASCVNENGSNPNITGTFDLIRITVCRNGFVGKNVKIQIFKNTLVESRKQNNLSHCSFEIT